MINKPAAQTSTRCMGNVDMIDWHSRIQVSRTMDKPSTSFSPNPLTFDR